MRLPQQIPRRTGEPQQSAAHLRGGVPSGSVFKERRHENQALQPDCLEQDDIDCRRRRPCLEEPAHDFRAPLVRAVDHRHQERISRTGQRRQSSRPQQSFPACDPVLDMRISSGGQQQLHRFHASGACDAMKGQAAVPVRGIRIDAFREQLTHVVQIGGVRGVHQAPDDSRVERRGGRSSRGRRVRKSGPCDGRGRHVLGDGGSAGSPPAVAPGADSGLRRPSWPCQAISCRSDRWSGSLPR